MVLFGLCSGPLRSEIIPSTGLPALLSLYYLQTSIVQGNRYQMTICGPWMTYLYVTHVQPDIQYTHEDASLPDRACLTLSRGVAILETKIIRGHM